MVMPLTQVKSAPRMSLGRGREVQLAFLLLPHLFPVDPQVPTLSLLEYGERGLVSALSTATGPD